MIPLSLYVHIPWCEKKCPYCDFNSHTAKASIDEAGYVAALLADLATDLQGFGRDALQRPLQSIFIGGGTPSLFRAESIQALLAGIKQQLDFAEDIEITLEANPGSAEAHKFTGFREAGVNRLSIGVQSFNAAQLRALGRVHGRQEAIQAASLAHQAGYDNFNLDLMFGLPEQSLQQCLDDVAQAIALQPTHLSCYQLTIEPNTLFHHQPPITPGEELLWEMQMAIQPMLAAAAYQQYEVSAYAQAGRQCRHNLNYWRFGDYLGIGAGAHGKITDNAGQVFRNWKIKHPAAYLQGVAAEAKFTGGVKPVAASELPFEFMLNGLRLSDGFALDLFAQRTGLDIAVAAGQLQKHQQLGLLTIEQQQLLLTARGRTMLNEMLQDYLPD